MAGYVETSEQTTVAVNPADSLAAAETSDSITSLGKKKTVFKQVYLETESMRN